MEPNPNAFKPWNFEGAFRAKGITSSALAYTLIKRAKIQQRHQVLLAPSKWVDPLLKNLGTMAHWLGEAPPLMLPTWGHSPFSSISPSLKVRHQRIETLHRLAQSTKPTVLLSTFAACHQATLPTQDLKNAQISLQVETSVGSRESLIRRLQDSGYARTDPAQDPGTFAVRGEIFDIYPPGGPPIRVELFDDLIERIRVYDPELQTTSKQSDTLAGLTLPPAREVLIPSTHIATIRSRLKKFGDEEGLPRKVRDPLLEGLNLGQFPEHADTWAPLLGETPANLWDHLQATSIGYDAHIYDEPTALEEYGQFCEEQHEERGHLQNTLTPKVEALFPALAQSPKVVGLFDRAVASHSDLEAQEFNIKTLDSLPKSHDPNHVERLKALMDQWTEAGLKIVIFAGTQSIKDRITFLLKESLGCEPEVRVGKLDRGFLWEDFNLLLLADHEFLGTKPKASRQVSPQKDWAGLKDLSDLKVGDAVVHVEHGIGKYLGLKRVALDGAGSDFLQVEYAAGDKLYVPVYRLNLIQKYSAGGGSDQVRLNKLGGQQFEKAKSKVKNAVRKLAIDLVELYAKRKIHRAAPFHLRDNSFREFEDRFPFDETPDQLRAIEDTLEDLEQGKLTDRLICGDVGFGKTEVAIRAAFLAVQSGKQVAVLVPTTILAQQHEVSFRERMRSTGALVDSVSRFKPLKEQREVIEKAHSGKLDVIIGTHRLLSKDVGFKDLGLLIIDEEHRFGVEHKEKIKSLKTKTHVLTLTATPIPRTLHMALAGLRDISLITTPPVDRLPIQTYVSQFDEHQLEKAIRFELSRGGQVFFLHNRVQGITEVATTIKKLVPTARVEVAHGQMKEGELEKKMLSFYKKEADILVCTTIIESGLDVPNANTMIVNNAHAFGLAQLYQIRGRVGRSDRRAYCYLFVPSRTTLTEDARSRLEAIQRFVELGSGFNIASHDLEIRGGGNLLGAEQSGHVASVGFDLYTELLEEAVQELQGEVAQEESFDPEIKTPFGSFLDEKYIPDVQQRLNLYRRLSTSTDLEGLEEELHDRYGPLPPEAQNLLWVLRLKTLIRDFGIDLLQCSQTRVVLHFLKMDKLDTQKLVRMATLQPKTYKLSPDSKLVITMEVNGLKDLFFKLEEVLNSLSQTK